MKKRIINVVIVFAAIAIVSANLYITSNSKDKPIFNIGLLKAYADDNSGFSGYVPYSRLKAYVCNDFNGYYLECEMTYDSTDICNIGIEFSLCYSDGYIDKEVSYTPENQSGHHHTWTRLYGDGYVACYGCQEYVPCTHYDRIYFNPAWPYYSCTRCCHVYCEHPIKHRENGNLYCSLCEKRIS